MKAFLLSLCLFAALPAQQRTVTLHGSRNPRIAKMTDEGPVDDIKRIAGLSIRFKPSSAQMAALERLLEDQQNASSPVYHTWLTPEEFGERFGISENDLVKVKDWLAAQGFQIDIVARSRTYVSFSGTAAQVRQAFRTELHRFRSGVGTHFANASDAEIPAELEPLVSSIGGLHDFRTKAHSRPMYNLDKGGHYLAPGDLNTLYNIHTLHQKGFTGAGQKIVIVGQSRYQKSDLDLFRSKFGLPPTTPKVVAVPGYPDPGLTDTDEFVEAELDIEVAGIAAPDATLVFVYSDDVWTATQYAIDQNLGPVISSSYSLCENWALPTDVTAFRSMAQQASAQGITWLGISGDAGAAGCDPHDADPAAYYGANVTLPASLPEVTGIGGTEFAEGTGTYWTNSNNADGSSVMSYVPETAWNDSSTLVKGLAASGGGPSILWDRPTWQSGPGLPHDNVRHVPDISFTASWRHDAYAVIYKGGLLNAGGTSAGAPFFAGALALLNQYVVKAGFQSKPGLGNINPRLYQLAQTTTGVFHDIVTGNNIVPCDLDGWYCDTGSYGYQAGVGYDDVTGLGSIDIGRLVENWGPPVSGQQTSSARMLLTSAPGTVIGNAKADASCDANHPYSQILILQEIGGVEVRLNKFTAGGNDASDQIVRWFGSLRLPPYGTMFSHICWTLDSVPTTLDYEVAGVDSSGRILSAVLRVAFKAAAANPGTLSVSKNAVDLSAGAASINIDAPAGEQWTVTAFIENRKSGWLAASPQSGKGPGQVNLTASGADLAPGVYSATLVFQSPNTAPQYIIVPVSVTISGASDMSISSAGNAASFQKVFAPGMLMSLFGTHLSGATKAAESVPLPQSLEGVTVTVNGIAAPLWYVSPGQINLQLPFETAIGKALVAVNNNGRVTSTLIKIDSTAPGIFTNNGAIAPAATAKRGGSVVLYLTGDGETNPMLDTGAPPAANTPLGQLPKPRAPLTVTVGGVKADVAFAGNPWLVGVTQVNFTVPANAPVGAQPVVVTVGGIASALATLNVQ